MSKVIFHGETSFWAWGDSSTTGPWIKLAVHPDDIEQFKILKARAGKEPGARLATVLALIGPDEVVVDHPDTPAPSPAPPPRMKPAPRMGDLGRCAVLWCKRRDFWEWATGGDAPGVVESEADAKEFVLWRCGVLDKYESAASRKHLDTDHECGRLFLDLIFYPFTQYAKDNGIDLTQKP